MSDQKEFETEISKAERYTDLFDITAKSTTQLREDLCKWLDERISGAKFE